MVTAHIQRFNPAVGVNYNLRRGLLHTRVTNEGVRAPTAVELTCGRSGGTLQVAQQLSRRPALAPGGLKDYGNRCRGVVGTMWHWSAAAYRTRLRNDIQFISSQHRCHQRRITSPYRHDSTARSRAGARDAHDSRRSDRQVYLSRRHVSVELLREQSSQFERQWKRRHRSSSRRSEFRRIHATS